MSETTHWFTLTVSLDADQDADVARSILQEAIARLEAVHGASGRIRLIGGTLDA